MDHRGNEQEVQQRAQIKFAIKQLESRLFYNLESSPNDKKSLLTILNELISAYQTLYNKTSSILPYQHRPPAGTIMEYAVQLHLLRTELYRQYESEKGKQLLDKLWNCLSNLYYCVKQHPFIQAQKPNPLMSSLFQEQKSDISNWFYWLGDLICNHRDYSGWTNQFCQSLSNTELKQLARAFNSKEYAAVINTVFYLRFHPAELLTEPYEPEALLQIKHQLDDLHEHIHRLFHTLESLCYERCHLKLADYLYHGSELPTGIAFIARNEHLEVIKTVLKNYPLDFNINVPSTMHNPVQDFLRAYKFWFNPNRLIDSIMGLWSSTIEETSSQQQSFEPFSKKVHQYYQKLSTSECIDLFGYFTNKDSQYLMRCLQTAASDKECDLLPIRNSQDKKLIALVAKLFSISIEGLYTELNARNLQTTRPYSATDKPKKFQPGKRNLKAVTHIIKHYSTIEHQKNSMLENLFNTMEDQN